MMDCPTMLSVIIPVYNSEEYIAACMESVLSQQGVPYEMILVDDGSEDASAQIIEGKMQGHGNIRLIRSRHAGVSSARNLGIDAASGKYITFMDSDDTVQARYFEQAVAMERDAELDLMVFGIRYIDCVDPSKSTTWKVAEKTYASGGDVADAYVKTGAMMLYSNCNKIYRRSMIAQNGIRFREEVQFGEDRLFNWDYLRVCKKVCYRDQSFYQYYHRRNASLSQRYIPGFIRTVAILHGEKMRCIRGLATNASEEEIRRFARRDAIVELANVKEHLCAHYPALDRAERKKELRLLMDSELLQSAQAHFEKRGPWEVALRASARSNTTYLLDAFLKMNGFFRGMRDADTKG